MTRWLVASQFMSTLRSNCLLLMFHKLGHNLYVFAQRSAVPVATALQRGSAKHKGNLMSEQLDDEMYFSETRFRDLWAVVPRQCRSHEEELVHRNSSTLRSLWQDFEQRTGSDLDSFTETLQITASTEARLQEIQASVQEALPRVIGQFSKPVVWRVGSCSRGSALDTCFDLDLLVLWTRENSLEWAKDDFRNLIRGLLPALCSIDGVGVYGFHSSYPRIKCSIKGVKCDILCGLQAKSTYDLDQHVSLLSTLWHGSESTCALDQQMSLPSVDGGDEEMHDVDDDALDAAKEAFLQLKPSYNVFKSEFIAEQKHASAIVKAARILKLFWMCTLADMLDFENRQSLTCQRLEEDGVCSMVHPASNPGSPVGTLADVQGKSDCGYGGDLTLEEILALKPSISDFPLDNDIPEDLLFFDGIDMLSSYAFELLCAAAALQGHAEVRSILIWVLHKVSLSVKFLSIPATLAIRFSRSDNNEWQVSISKESTERLGPAYEGYDCKTFSLAVYDPVTSEDVVHDSDISPWNVVFVAKRSCAALHLVEGM